MSIEFYDSKLNLTGFALPVRATVVRDNNFSVFISPFFSGEEAQRIRENGGVTDIVAPTLLHHLHVQKARQEFPQATLWGVSGFKEKRADVLWQKILSRKDWPYKNQLEILEIAGCPKMNEAVFFHRETRTLIVSDLCFNLQRPEGLLSPILLRLMGTYKRFNVSGLLLMQYLKDKVAFRESMRELMKWDFDRIVMSHGDIVDSGGKPILERALRNRGLI